ncbi:MAG: diguanylate cyclase [Thiobacillus sp.]|nr:diguanylate cyclase [Thiobacillus sp.]
MTAAACRQAPAGIDYRISRVSAEFRDATVELAFREAAHPRRVRDTRWSVGIAALFYLLFTVVDYFNIGDGEAYQVLFLTRLTVAGFGLLAAFTARRFWRAMMDGVTPSLVAGLALTGFLSSTFLRDYEPGWHAMTFCVMLMAIYVFIPNRFLASLSLALVGSLVFLWLLSQHFHFSAGNLFGLGLMLLAVNIIGALTAHRLSRQEREGYRDAQVLRLANERLQGEVERRERLEGELRDLLDQDDLTGIANRRRFLTQAERELEVAQRRGEVSALLRIEIDFYQQLVDTYGQSECETLVRALADVCRQGACSDDLVARLGREEFAVLLARRDARQCDLFADDLVRAARAAPARLSGGTIHFTVSVGMARVHAGEPFAALMRRSEAALRVARQRGRDCWASD